MKANGITHEIDAFYGGTAPEHLHGQKAISTWHKGLSSYQMEMDVFRRRKDIAYVYVRDYTEQPYPPPQRIEV
jgi:hypothetical protein